MTRTRLKINLAGSGIDPFHGPHDIILNRLTTGPGGERVSAHQRGISAAQPACAVNATAKTKPDAAGLEKFMLSPNKRLNPFRVETCEPGIHFGRFSRLCNQIPDRPFCYSRRFHSLHLCPGLLALPAQEHTAALTDTDQEH